VQIRTIRNGALLSVMVLMAILKPLPLHTAQSTPDTFSQASVSLNFD